MATWQITVAARTMKQITAVVAPRHKILKHWKRCIVTAKLANADLRLLSRRTMPVRHGMVRIEMTLGTSTPKSTRLRGR